MVNKQAKTLLAYSLFCWYTDLVIQGHLKILNVPSAGFLVPMFAIPTVMYLFNFSGNRAAKVGRVVLYILLVPFIVGGLLPPMMDIPEGDEWNYVIGSFRFVQFVIGFALVLWALDNVKQQGRT